MHIYLNAVKEELTVGRQNEEISMISLSLTTAIIQKNIQVKISQGGRRKSLNTLDYQLDSVLRDGDERCQYI